MPSVATSFASVRANPVTAARMLFDSIRPSTGCFTAIDVTLMMRPHRRSFMPGQHRARELHRAAQRQVAPRVCHVVPVVLLERTGRRTAGIRDEHVHAAEARQRRVATTRCTSGAIGQVGGDRRATSHAGLAANRVARRARARPRRARTSRASRLRAPAPPRPRDRVRGSPRRRARPSRAVRDPWAISGRVAVGLVQPVLARRTEDVHVERVLERFGLVRHVRRNVQHLAGAHDRLSRVSSSPIQNLSAPSRM